SRASTRSRRSSAPPASERTRRQALNDALVSGDLVEHLEPQAKTGARILAAIRVGAAEAVDEEPSRSAARVGLASVNRERTEQERIARSKAHGHGRARIERSCRQLPIAGFD